MSDDPRRELAEIVEDLDAHMRFLKSVGTSGIPKDPKAKAAAATAGTTPMTDATDVRARLVEQARQMQQTGRGAPMNAPTRPPLPPPDGNHTLPPAPRLSATTPASVPPGVVPSSQEPIQPVHKPASQSTLFTSPEVKEEAVEILTMETIRERLGDCQRCKLHAGRTHLVFGEGDVQADLMFIGEGPGKDEDEQGRPFVGRAGQELTRWIELGMKKTRDDVYIANIVKCRPPNNREPETDEAETCLPFLKLQIASVKPKALVLLGNTAVRRLLTVKQGITKIRGTWFEYQGIPAMPTYHPSYIIRNPKDRVRKGHVWSDLKMVMEKIGWPIPQKGE